jgi:hypothetical protein
VYADAVWYDALDARSRYIELIGICCRRHPGVALAGSAAAVLHGLTILAYPEYPAKVDVLIPDWNKRSVSDITHQHSGEVNNANGATEIFSTINKPKLTRDLVAVLTPKSAPDRTRDLASNRASKSSSDLVHDHTRDLVSDLDGCRIQSVADALFFIMRHNSEAEAIVALHSALHRCSDKAAFTIKKSKLYAFPMYSQEAFDLCAELQHLIEKNEGASGIRKAKRILYLATDGAESPGESLTILYCYRFGLALPIVNPTLLDSDGLFLGRVDLLWNRGGARIERRFRTDIMNGRYCRVLEGPVKIGDTVIIEFDGKGKYVDEKIRAGRTADKIVLEEKDRENEIRRYGHGMLRINWDAFHAPELLYKKLIEGGVPTRKSAKKNLAPLIDARK